jgi:hypothetical protein
MLILIIFTIYLNLCLVLVFSGLIYGSHNSCLIWYANIPEEVTYFKFRIEYYTILWSGCYEILFSQY